MQAAELGQPFHCVELDWLEVETFFGRVYRRGVVSPLSHGPRSSVLTLFPEDEAIARRQHLSLAILPFYRCVTRLEQ
jgi:hypothetical protein